MKSGMGTGFRVPRPPPEGIGVLMFGGSNVSRESGVGVGLVGFAGGVAGFVLSGLGTGRLSQRKVTSR